MGTPPLRVLTGLLLGPVGKLLPQAVAGRSVGHSWTPLLVPALEAEMPREPPWAKEAAGTPRASSQPSPHSSPHPHPPVPWAGQMGPWREEAEGGRQAGEEVISPQLAPLPRSRRARRKPPGLPRVVLSPLWLWPGLSPNPFRADMGTEGPAPPEHSYDPPGHRTRLTPLALPPKKP